MFPFLPAFLSFLSRLSLRIVASKFPTSSQVVSVDPESKVEITEKRPAGVLICKSILLTRRNSSSRNTSLGSLGTLSQTNATYSPFTKGRSILLRCVISRASCSKEILRSLHFCTRGVGRLQEGNQMQKQCFLRDCHCCFLALLTSERVPCSIFLLSFREDGCGCVRSLV